MRNLCVVALLMCLGGTLSQFGVNARTIADEKTAQGAIHADEQVNRAILDSEGGALKALLTDDFIYINSSGALLDRDKYLQDLRFTQFESFTPHEVKARIYGDTVVLTARLFANWRKQGGDGSGRFRYARVYIWHQDRWQLASSQLTPMNE